MIRLRANISKEKRDYGCPTGVRDLYCTFGQEEGASRESLRAVPSLQNSGGALEDFFWLRNYVGP